MLHVLLVACVANSTMLVLHEIESAFEREWEVLRLPGGITGFLLLHVPILPILLLCPLAVSGGGRPAMAVSALLGLCGALPFAVHRLIVPTPDRFNRPASRVLMALNGLVGVAQAVLSLALWR